MDILKIATAGSVDDGKSTLIGRLLYETNSITKDKIEALETASQRRGLDFLDLSLLTDGLIAEREQGITIDVANIYFSTPTRKYIIADTPGHIEYTRNMITGASNASVSVILIDARQGVVEQTKRHFYIASMLRIKNVVVCVNKMDLVNYSQSRFEEIRNEFLEIASKIKFEGQAIEFIPISSLYGENISKKSTEISWYEGGSLLDCIEQIDPKSEIKNQKSIFPVQLVIRPKSEEYHDYRGYAGKIASGSFTVGDAVTILPTGRTTQITSIEKFESKLESAQKDESIVITLKDDVDVSRGNMIVKTGQEPQIRKELSAQICWLDATPLTAGKTYLLQHGINRVKAKVQSIDSSLDIVSLDVLPQISELNLNGIGWAKIKLAAPIFADGYAQNPANGAFILIDEFSNGTVGVGFVVS